MFYSISVFPIYTVLFHILLFFFVSFFIIITIIFYFDVFLIYFFLYLVSVVVAVVVLVLALLVVAGAGRSASPGQWHVGGVSDRRVGARTRRWHKVGTAKKKKP